jgi:hypothetical protein
MSEPNSAEKPPEQLDGELQTLLPWMVENSPAETARLLGRISRRIRGERS